jgi:hypothetical protein
MHLKPEFIFKIEGVYTIWSIRILFNEHMVIHSNQND